MRHAKSVSLRSSLFFAACAVCSNAIANNGGVHGPNVKAGTSSAEVRMNTTNSNDASDGRQQYRMHYQQAFNDEFQLRMVLQYRDFGTFEYDNVKAELLYNYKKASNDNYAAGVRFDVRTRRGQRPEDFVLNWTHQYNISDNMFVRAIGILGKNLTENGAGDKPSSIGTRFSISQKFTNGIMLSAELYNTYGELSDLEDFEDQTHQFGPAIMYRKNGWYAYARYLKGLSSATADNNFQFRIGKQF